MSMHDLTFEPKNDEAHGWAIDEGKPRIWWRATLADEEKVLIDDELDLSEQEIHIEIIIGTETTDGKTPYHGGKEPEAKWGGLIWKEDYESLRIFVAVSKDNFERIFAAARDGKLPSIKTGFGPKTIADKLEGPITLDSEYPNNYRWNTKEKASIPIESLDFWYAKTQDSSTNLEANKDKLEVVEKENLQLETFKICLLLGIAIIIWKQWYRESFYWGLALGITVWLAYSIPAWRRRHEESRARRRQIDADKLLRREFYEKHAAIRKKHDPKNEWNEGTPLTWEYERDMAKLNRQYRTVMDRQFDD